MTYGQKRVDRIGTFDIQQGDDIPRDIYTAWDAPVPEAVLDLLAARLNDLELYKQACMSCYRRETQGAQNFEAQFATPM